jgi:hypothetical protein
MSAAWSERLALSRHARVTGIAPLGAVAVAFNARHSLHAGVAIAFM